ncbi:uncharacterized protein LOC141507278 isoform X2 [Macrotis lagotis]
MSLLKHPNTSQPSHCHYRKNAQERPSWLKHPPNTSKMPQLNHKMMALPHLHHLTKTSHHHKQHTMAPILPLAKTDIPTKKISGALIPNEECFIPPLGPKHQQDSPLAPDHLLEHPSGSDHLPKIFPACNHSSTEDVMVLNQKDPVLSFSDHQTEAPFSESHRSKTTTLAKIVPKTETKTSKPLPRTPTQKTKSLPRPKRRIKATNALLGLFNLDPVFHPLAKSLPHPLLAKAPYKTPVVNYWAQVQSLKGSHKLQSRETFSFLQYHHSRPPTVPTSAHLKHRNKPTTEGRYNPHPLHAPSSTTHVSVQTDKDNWETLLLRKYFLDTSSSSPDLDTSTTLPEPSISIKTNKDPREAESQGSGIQDTLPSSSDLETDMNPESTLHVSIQTEPVTWEAIFSRIELQETLPFSSDVGTDLTPEPAFHASIQTEPITWETIFSKGGLQETLLFSSDVSREPTLHTSFQTEPDSWSTVYPETDQEEIFLRGQDDRITLLGSSPSNITLSGPPQLPDPWVEHMPESSTWITLHPELEQWKTTQETDNLGTLLSSQDLDTKNISKPTVHESIPIKKKDLETIPQILGISNYQKITLIDKDYETATLLDLDDKERPLSSPHVVTTPLPSPYHQAKDISSPDAQAALQQKLKKWAIFLEETNLWDTLKLSTESETENTSVLIDHISDEAEQEKFEIIDVVSTRTEYQEPNLTQNTPVLIDHISDVSEQENFEIIDIMPLRIEHQEPTQNESTPVLTDYISNVTEEEKFEFIDIMPLRIEYQDPNHIVKDHRVTFLSLDNDKENALLGPDHQVTLLLSPIQKQETENTVHCLAQDIVQIGQESGKMTPWRIGQKATFVKGQNEAMLPVVLDPKDPAQLVLEPQITPSSSTDLQAENLPDLSTQVSPQPEPDPSDTMSSGTKHRFISLGDQVTTLLRSDHKEMTLSRPDHNAALRSNPERQSEVVEALRTTEHSAKLSEGQEQGTPPLTSNLSVTLPSISDNQAKAGTEPTNMPSIPSAILDEEKIAPPSCNKKISPSRSNLQAKAPTGHDHQPDTELSSSHRDEAESGFLHQLQTMLKKQTELQLNYIKPNTIDEGTDSEKTVNAIIHSIPQEKIKSDLYKSLSHDGFSPCDYKVCLICASWIPDGCPHEGMKYPCEAHLLAIPIPMPKSEEEIGVKFVLKFLQVTISSLFRPSNTHSHLKKSLEGEETSHIPVLSRPKWFHFILGMNRKSEISSSNV